MRRWGCSYWRVSCPAWDPLPPYYLPLPLDSNPWPLVLSPCFVPPNQVAQLTGEGEVGKAALQAAQSEIRELRGILARSEGAQDLVAQI